MSEATDQIATLTARAADLQIERRTREASALAHEQAAREDRLAMSAAKKELEEINGLLRHEQVRNLEKTALATAQKAQADAEQAKKSVEELLTRLTEKEKALDAKMAEAVAPPAQDS